MMSLQILKIDAMVAISVLALLVSFFSFVIIYNKAVKNSVNKTDVDCVKTEMKTYVDDKTRALHHRLEEQKNDNEKDHDRIRQESLMLVSNLEKKLDLIYGILKDMKK